MKRTIVALAAISLTVLFAACGQTGPLYLPGNPSKVEKIEPVSGDKEAKKKEASDAPTT